MQRRKFLKNAAATAAGAFIAPTIVPSSVFGKNAPSNRITLGHIGAGRQGNGNIREALRFGQTVCIAVSDCDRRRSVFAKKTLEEQMNRRESSRGYVDVKMYDDYRDLLADPGIDAVLINTPDHWHDQQAMEAALAGKHIYLEKPNSLTVATGRVMSDVVRKSGVICQIGTQQRSWEQFRVAAELVRNGRIGKLHTVKVGLPGDPSGPEFPEMPVPENLNYDMWLGSTPYVPYTEEGVHPREGFGRPGWLRREQFGAGMITGWGQHHFDSAAWGMDTEYTGPVSIQAVAEFPKSGTWDVHGDFMVKAEYANGITMYTSGGFPNGIRYEGSDGWVFVSRGDYRVTDSDPVSQAQGGGPLQASNPSILRALPGQGEIHLYKSANHIGNWLECIENGKEPICPVEMGHRACTVCLISHIAMHVPGLLKWDPVSERFTNSDVANSMLSRPQRYPYGTDYVKIS
jgi:myo-inositol 2-dehydrogenase / D-chiro-inositol 1-dehydrogenase